jgi:hypothetical protein
MASAFLFLLLSFDFDGRRRRALLLLAALLACGHSSPGFFSIIQFVRCRE